MQTVEITFARAVKVWWSFVWRSAVLGIPVAFVALPLMFFVFPHPPPGGRLSPADFQSLAGKFFFVWLIIMVASILVHIQAMRWMLRTKWSDFRLTATNE
jgi:hypothetical protein